MKRGEFSEYKIELTRKAGKEFKFFKYKMFSKNRKKIFENCNKISFYCCVYEYFTYADGISQEHIEACVKYEKPIAELYKVYQKYEYLQYGRWEEIEELLNVLVREQEDGSGQKVPMP